MMQMDSIGLPARQLGGLGGLCKSTPANLKHKQTSNMRLPMKPKQFPASTGVLRSLVPRSIAAMTQAAAVNLVASTEAH